MFPTPPVIRRAAEANLPGLMSVRPDERTHRERFSCQEEDRWVYLIAAASDSPRIGGRGAIFGFVVLIWAGDEHHVGYPILADLLVREPYRGSGLGNRLMERAEWLCRERGLPKIGLSVNPTKNPRALALYERRGYYPTGQIPHCDILTVPDEHGQPQLREDWCICLVKDLTQEN